jgi:hypothetical protein
MLPLPASVKVKGQKLKHQGQGSFLIFNHACKLLLKCIGDMDLFHYYAEQILD